MAWTEHISSIYDQLRKQGHSAVIDEMIKEYGIGGTAGEQFSIICTWLAKMKNQYPQLYSLIKEDADKILQEGIDIKYFTEDYYKGL